MLVYSAVVAVVWNRIETSCASPNILIESPKLAGGGQEDLMVFATHKCTNSLRKNSAFMATVLKHCDLRNRLLM